MGLMDKIKTIVNPDDMDEYATEDYDYDTDEAYDDSSIPTASRPEARQQIGSLGQNSALELKVIRPDRFEMVTQIADHLINNRTVVLNFENTSRENMVRMIDFLSGVAYSIEGHLKKVANNTFVITPGNVSVSQEQVPGQQQEAPAASGNDIFNM